jgi:hypothetical protein
VDSPRVRCSHGMSRIIVLVCFIYPKASRVPCFGLCGFFFFLADALHK